ncbi:transporter substrate-binding domain-containing protein [Motiliproteus sp. MSK22-1]|uniref:transporter substrate-binding domain-containing protein n=1 Tax=Motiliproteus sp. MSK22-1 TaxID=1897630 RepID=UPI0009789582|nr:transporter substrate-binding domain-containing protein [Motiliproteus sp. MSK22-1]OMH29455.1 histidine kinase [Motiliproteus sp. MSK22-1]
MLNMVVSSVAFAQESPDSSLNRTIRIGGDHNYPPYEFIDENGQPSGYNVELTQAIAEVMGMKVEFVLAGWDQMRIGLENGELDALQGMAYSEERSKLFSFAPPHAIVHQSVFGRKGAASVSGLKDLRDKSVIVQRLGIMHDQMVQNDVGAELILVDTHADALRLLASGQHDYALVANLPSLYLSRELGLSNIVPLGKPFVAQRYGHAVKKGNEELLAQIGEGLAILKNTGRQQQIYDKWFGPLEISGLPWKQLGQIAAGISVLLVLILGGIMIWNRALSQQVSRRTEELRMQQQQLIQADKMTSLGVLVSGVAHEINNPSSLLLLNLPLLKDACKDAEEILDAHYQKQGEFFIGGLKYSRMREEIPAMLDDMLDGSNRIKRIVDDLRDFARQGPADLSESVNLNEVVKASIRLVDNSIRKATEQFDVQFAEQLPRVRGNAQRIEQVVINLIVNACQSLQNRDQGVRVRTFYRSANNAVILEVMDEGCGIEPQHLSRLQDPFFTTKRESGGTGLGLSVSASIIQEHGGTLEFDSRLGEGTRVTLSLPADVGVNPHEESLNL